MVDHVNQLEGIECTVRRGASRTIASTPAKRSKGIA